MSQLSAADIDREREAVSRIELAAGQTWRNWRSDRTIIEVIGSIIFYRTGSAELWCSREAWTDWVLCSDAKLVGATEASQTATQEPGSATDTPGSVNLDPPAHPDDLAVDRFAVAMKQKLALARARGRHGWETMPEWTLWPLLVNHIPKDDPVDIANFAMFIWCNRIAAGEGPAPRIPRRSDPRLDPSYRVAQPHREGI